MISQTRRRTGSERTGENKVARTFIFLSPFFFLSTLSHLSNATESCHGVLLSHLVHSLPYIRTTNAWHAQSRRWNDGGSRTLRLRAVSRTRLKHRTMFIATERGDRGQLWPTNGRPDKETGEESNNDEGGGAVLRLVPGAPWRRSTMLRSGSFGHILSTLCPFPLSPSLYSLVIHPFHFGHRKCS